MRRHGRRAASLAAPRRAAAPRAVYFEKIDGEGHLFQMGDDCQKKAGVTVHEVCLLDALCTNNVRTATL